MSGFQEVLDELGITEEELNASLRAQIQEHGMAPKEYWEVAYIGLSEIHKRGVFAEVSQARGQRFMPVRLGKQVTLVGCYVNHSNTPNCQLVHYRNGDQYLESLQWIYAGDELTQDYRVAVTAEETP